MNKDKKLKIWLLLVIAFAILVRLAFFLEYKRKCPFYYFPMADSFLYLNLANEIIHEGWLGSKVFYYAPLYPYILAIIKRLLGEGLLFVYIIQSIVGILNLYLIYLLGKITIGKKAGLFATTLALFYAPLLYFETKVMPTTFGLFFILLGLYLLFRSLENRKSVNFFFVGLLIGISCLIRPNFLLFLIFSIPFIIWSLAQDKSGVFKSILIYCLAAGLIIGLVTLRNYIVGKDFVLISYHGGVTFYHGNNPFSRGAFGPGLGRSLEVGEQEFAAKIKAEQELGRQLKPSQISNFWFKKGLSFIKNNPQRYRWLVVRKLLLVGNNGEVGSAYCLPLEKEFIHALKITFLPFGIISSLGLLGAIVGLKRFKRLWMLYLFAFSIFVVLISFQVTSRYRLPMTVILTIFSGFGLEEIIVFIKEKRKRDLIIAVIFCAFIFTFSSLNLGNYKIDSVPNRTNLARSYFFAGKFDAAIATYKKSLEFNPNYAPAWADLGNVYYELRDYKKAREVYQKAISIDPDFERKIGARLIQDNSESKLPEE